MELMTAKVTSKGPADGIGIVATRDRVIIIRPGDTVHRPPGEEHWHGALPDRFMTHPAMWEDDDATWGDHVRRVRRRGEPGIMTGSSSVLVVGATAVV